jgi:hypothetical protein
VSRHIDHGNRLVYNIVDGNLWIQAAKDIMRKNDRLYNLSFFFIGS